MITNTNKRPELIICFFGITGHARRVLSENIQRNLFKMGYRWSDGLWDGKPQCLDKPILNICSQMWNPRDITYSNGPVTVENASALVFDAGTQSQEFLDAAKKGLIETRTIEGVNVTITPDSVDLNATDLLTRVASQAHKVQNEVFGR